MTDWRFGLTAAERKALIDQEEREDVVLLDQATRENLILLEARRARRLHPANGDRTPDDAA